jgi:hypothetical protein
LSPFVIDAYKDAISSNDLDDVLIDGWTIAHPVFSRARCALRDLDGRFGLKRIFFVRDRGMVTAHGEKLDDVRALAAARIFGRDGRRSASLTVTKDHQTANRNALAGSALCRRRSSVATSLVGSRAIAFMKRDCPSQDLFFTASPPRLFAGVRLRCCEP